jgi:predicted lipid-binding transport protein (Tim44 family)
MMSTTSIRPIPAPRSHTIAPTSWLRVQYLIDFAVGTTAGALMPGAMLGMLLGGPMGAMAGAIALLPLGVAVALPVMSIWLVGALGTASAIELLHR